MAIVVVGKSLGAYLLVRAFGRPDRDALPIAAALAQVGEFSCILVALGRDSGLLPPEAQSLVVAGAILSITVNLLLLAVVGRRAVAGRSPVVG